jgi:glycosyltransferase involved in cell wall biosynthesis
VKTLLCFIPRITGGGAERFLLNFLRHVDRSRFAPSVAIVRRGGGFESEIPEGLRVFELDGGPAGAGRLSWLGSIRYTAAAARLIRREKPDAVLSFGSLFNGVVAVAAAGARFRGPVLLIEAIHESTEIDRHAAVARWARRVWLRTTYPLASAVVAVSDGVAADLRARFGIGRRLHVVHNGIDLEAVRAGGRQPVDHPWLRGGRPERLLVACGRLVPQKGFRCLIAAMRELPEDVRLILIGDGEEREALERMVRQWALEARVELLGYDRNPYRYIARADLFVMPSLWDGFSMVLAEAMALGTPVVASDCPSGPREILEGGLHGRLVPPGDPGALAGGIRGLLEDDARRRRLGAAGRARAETFSAHRAIEAYTHILERAGRWS